MVSLQSEPLNINLEQELLIELLKSPEAFNSLLDYKSVRHLTIYTNGFSFILKRAATFHFILKKHAKQEVYYESKTGMPFHSVLRFVINEDGCLVVEFESDTTDYMDFMLEKRVKKMLGALVSNLEAQTKR